MYKDQILLVPNWSLYTSFTVCHFPVQFCECTCNRQTCTHVGSHRVTIHCDMAPVYCDIEGNILPLLFHYLPLEEQPSFV